MCFIVCLFLRYICFLAERTNEAAEDVCMLGHSTGFGFKEDQTLQLQTLPIWGRQHTKRALNS